MAAYIGPLLLVLLGIGGLVFVLARKVRGGEGGVSSAEEEPVHQPLRLFSPTPAGESRAFSLSGAGRVLSLGRGIGSAVRGIVRGAAFIARVPWRIARRVRRRKPVSLPKTPDMPGVALPPPPVRESVEQVTEPVASETTEVRDAAEAFHHLRLSSILPPEATEAPETPEISPEPEQARAQEEDVPVFAPSDTPLTREEPSLSSSEAADVRTFQDPVLAQRVERPPALDQPVAEPSRRTVALETHVREAMEGRRKVVGRVRASGRRGEDPRPSRRREPRAPAPRPAPIVPFTGEPPTDLASAERLLESGELSRAESLLTELLAANPRDVEAYRLLAVLYLKRSDFAQVKEVCEEALRRYPEATPLYGMLGRAYVELGQYGNALQMLQRAHDADEANVEYLEQLLKIAARMDRRPLVRVTAEKILALNPQHADAKKHLAKVAV